MLHRNRLVRGLLTIVLLTGILAGLAGRSLFTARAVGVGPTASRTQPSITSTPLRPERGIVISEFRSRGKGGAGDEFIELYNSSEDPFNLGNWLIKASDAAGVTTDLVTLPSGTTLSPGQHFLAASSAYSGSISPDLSYSSAFIPDDGGIAIYDDSRLYIVDQVGMSTGSAYREGAPLAALTRGRDQAYERKQGGSLDSCVDTADNSADFSLIHPGNPQNTLSPLRLCGVPVRATTTTITHESSDPSVVGQYVILDIAVTAGSAAPAGGTVSATDGTNSCWGDLQNGYAKCWIAFNRAGPKVLTATYSGHGVFAASSSAPEPHQVDPANTVTKIISDDPDSSVVGRPVTIRYRVSGKAPSLGAPGGKVKVSAGSSSCTGSLAYGYGQCTLTFGSLGTKNIAAAYLGNANYNPSISAVVSHKVVPDPAVVINEIAWSGTAASATDEWIELLNRRTYPIDLSGWRLRALDGEPDIPLTGRIPARGFYLLERGHDTTISDIRADQIYAGALEDTGEKVYLYDPSGRIVDRANAFSSVWTAGSLSGRGSMERRRVLSDNSSSWNTNLGLLINGRDANGRPVNGTPRRWNSSSTVIPTLTPTAHITITPTLLPGDHPDLAVSWMRIELEHPSCLLPDGDHLGLRIGVANIGRASAGSFVVSDGREQQTVAGLQAGETVALFFHYYSFPVEVMLDSAYTVTESDESNNHVIEWVPIPTEPLPCATATATAAHPPASVP